MYIIIKKQTNKTLIHRDLHQKPYSRHSARLCIEEIILYLSMAQYLSEIISKCDAIVVTGSPLTPEDIILYILNGLPLIYQAFKTAIRTNLQPLSLDDFYPLPLQ